VDIAAPRKKSRLERAPDPKDFFISVFSYELTFIRPRRHAQAQQAMGLGMIISLME
jgi:hypothetical protein